MKRKNLPLVVFALLLISMSTASAQTATDEQTAMLKSPLPHAFRYCWAQLNSEDELLELLFEAHKTIETKTHYAVSLPLIVDGKQKGNRIERRPQFLKTTHIRVARCKLDARSVRAYQPNGTRLSAKQLAEELVKPKMVVLSDSIPDDMMNAVLAKDCIVIVMPTSSLKFSIPDNSDK